MHWIKTATENSCYWSYLIRSSPTIRSSNQGLLPQPQELNSSNNHPLPHPLHSLCIHNNLTQTSSNSNITINNTSNILQGKPFYANFRTWSSLIEKLSVWWTLSTKSYIHVTLPGLQPLGPMPDSPCLVGLFHPQQQTPLPPPLLAWQILWATDKCRPPGKLHLSKVDLQGLLVILICIQSKDALITP